MSKLDDLLEAEGLSFDEYISEYGSENVVPGICMNDGCDFTTNVEPDQQKGWCDDCEQETVCSGIILLGAI